MAIAHHPDKVASMGEEYQKELKRNSWKFKKPTKTSKRKEDSITLPYETSKNHSLLFCFWDFLSFSQIPQLDVKHYRIEIFVSDETDEIKVDELIEFAHVDTNKPIILNLASYDRSHKGMQMNPFS